MSEVTNNHGGPILYYYPLFELSDKTSDAQAVIFTCRLNNNSKVSNVFLLAKTVNTVGCESYTGVSTGARAPMFDLYSSLVHVSAYYTIVY